MKKLYTRFFHIPKHEKIGEKVMLTRVATTIATIVVCLIAMSLTAYAYFSCDISSVSNVIQAAKFDAQITVTDESGNFVEPSAKEGKISTFAFTVPGTYTVTLEKGASSAQTGFCVVYVGENTYHTQQIGVDVLANNKKRESVSFTLQVKGVETVKIESHWGTSSHYDYVSNAENECYIVNSDPLKVIVVGTTDSVGNSTQEVTTTETQATSTTESTQTTVVETTTFHQTTTITETSTVQTTTAMETTAFVTTESTTITTEQTAPTAETTVTVTTTTEG